MLLCVRLVCNGPAWQDADCRVAQAVYDGHWLEVDSCSRTLLVVMERRSRPLSVDGAANIGKLDLDVCGEWLKAWYRLLQLLLKFM